jgi:hypothetical protein
MAAEAATCGVAIDVPVSAIYPSLPAAAAVMSVPGAEISGFVTLSPTRGPTDDELSIAEPSRATLATVSARSAAPGEFRLWGAL